MKVTSIVKETSLYSIGNLLNLGIGAITLPFFARLLTAFDFGILASCTVFSTFIITLIKLGVHQSILKQYHDFRDNLQRKHYLGSVLFYTCIWAFILFVILYLNQSLISRYLFPKISFYPYFTLAFWSAASTIPLFVSLAKFRVEHQAISFLIVSSSTAVGGILLSLILVYFWDDKVLAKLLGPVVINIMASLYLIVTKKVVFNFDIFPWINAVNFGKPLAFQWFVMDLVALMVTGELSTKLGNEGLGIFNMGRTLGQLIPGFIITSIELALVPLIYEELRRGRKSTLVKMNISFVFLVLTMFIIMLFIADIIVKTLLGPDFLASKQIMLIFSLSAIFRAAYTIPLYTLYFNNATNLVMIVNLAISIVSYFLVRSLVEIFGIEGAAYGLALTPVLTWLALSILNRIKHV